MIFTKFLEEKYKKKGLRCMCKDNINTNFVKISVGLINWIELTHWRVIVNVAINIVVT